MGQTAERNDQRQAGHRRHDFLWWLVAVVAALLLFALFFPFQVAHWSGRKARLLSISVVHAESGTPVPGAEITVFRGPPELAAGEPFPQPERSDGTTLAVTADADGRVSLLREFDAYGHEGLLENRGRVRFGNCYLQVTGRGYDPFQLRLADRLGERADFHDNSPTGLRIELKRTKADSPPEKAMFP